VYSFYCAGGYNCTMTIRDEQTQSWWSANDGVSMDGPMKGTTMRWHPFYQMTFGEFRELHPDGEVMAYGKEDAAWHRNPRHGHGTDYQPGSPGIEPFFLASWIGDGGEPDTRLPENTLLIGINEPEALRVYPLEHVKREGGVVHERIGGSRPIVVLCPYRSYTMAVYEAVLDGTEFTFRREDDRFIDDQTGSIWTVEGGAESGPLTGSRLRPIQWQWLEWHTFVSAHPKTAIWRSGKPPLKDPTDDPAFQAVVGALDESGYTVDACNWLHPTWSVIAAQDALALWVRGDPLELLRFADASDATDSVLLDRHARPFGNFVLRSNPEEHFSDWPHTRPLREARIAWSKLLDDDEFCTVVAGALAGHHSPTSKPRGAKTLLEVIAGAGYPVRTHGSRWNPGRNLDAGNCYEMQAPTRALDAFRVVIDGDCFLVSRFADAAAAREYAATEPYCTLTAGEIVLRSDPPGQYRAPYPIVSFDAPVDEVKWSRLLEDEKFRRLCEDFGKATP
jgi:hypothetical protein